jgi:hypothetical protein
LLAATLSLVRARAAPTSEGSDLLRGGADVDEQTMARLASRVGDDVVLNALAEPKDAIAQLAAIRAAPHVIDSASVLLPLATIAASRDPELAPLAAYKLRSVAQALVREGLARREVLPSTLAPARAALERLASDATARTDIRSYAGQAAHLLGTLGVPTRTSTGMEH